MRNPAIGLLEPAGAPAFFIIIALLGAVQLKTALLIGVILLVMSLFLFSMLAGRKVASSLRQAIFYSLAQLAIGLAIVWLKIVLE